MPKVIGVPLDLLEEPRGGECIEGSWWAVMDGKALFYQGNGSKGWTPQCNADERVTKHLINRPSLYPGSEAVYIEFAFLGRNWDEHWGHMLSPDLVEAATEIPRPVGA